MHFFFHAPATAHIYTLSLHDALPIYKHAKATSVLSNSVSLRMARILGLPKPDAAPKCLACHSRSEEHTSELQSHSDLVCRLLLEKKKKKNTPPPHRLSQ